MYWKAYRNRMRIEVLHVPDCPNLDRARDRLHEALRTAGISASTHQTEIDSPEAAARVGMRGSPTILVDGTDPFASATPEGSLSCRLYRTPEGVEGAPAVAQLVEVLSMPPRRADADRR